MDATVIMEDAIPFYRPSGNECVLFETAFRQGLPVMLKGPTGCGKTRFVSHMAARLGLSLNTVACHDDLTAADLTGRFLLKGGETQWVDGPLTHSVRQGGICYLDEVVEARKDVTVVLHPLTDDRRLLPLERTGELLEAPDNFMMVISYNPGYQNILKSLKPSTRQRFIGIDFDYPAAEQEVQIICKETGLDRMRCVPLVNLARSIRNLKDLDLEEGASTRLLVYCATLMMAGISPLEAAQATLIEPLSDEESAKEGLLEVVRATFE
ncbi:CbbQ/NirQ/NorQ/GpvN family protein [Paremcibacter congregatus]|uniref:AAA family ATPase n=1 Tax=Paremcibacter congregatus TaxID=2043170 RepID=A0A2G4YUN4_9PROT|nr:AAA family ATPase [Paremcibacter congregatus]QDE27015.1 CbbQ/NirQ/NorQ/GpvN family protein [Paremcibacter congregatus]